MEEILNDYNHFDQNQRKLRIGINGFGRIGKCILRLICDIQSNWGNIFEVVHINSNRLDSREAAYLYKYDTVHRTAKNQVDYISNKGEETLIIDNFPPIKITQYSNPVDIPWQDNDVDIVFECSGKFNKYTEAQEHNVAWIIVSAPCEGSDATVICGVNDEQFVASIEGELEEKEKVIVSAGSCTTNCLLPIVKAINEYCGMKSGFMTTIHSYTNDQSLVDSRHNDRRRGRSGACSIVPTTTGISKTLKYVMPEMVGRLNGSSLRVPTNNVSMVDLSFIPQRKISNVQEIVGALRDYSLRHPSIMGINDEALVSSDFIGDRRSCIIDAGESFLVGRGEDLCRVVGWYDNEYAFAERMLDICNLIGRASSFR